MVKGSIEHNWLCNFLVVKVVVAQVKWLEKNVVAGQWGPE